MGFSHIRNLEVTLLKQTSVDPVLVSLCAAKSGTLLPAT